MDQLERFLNINYDDSLLEIDIQQSPKSSEIDSLQLANDNDWNNSPESVDLKNMFDSFDSIFTKLADKELDEIQEDEAFLPYKKRNEINTVVVSKATQLLENCATITSDKMLLQMISSKICNNFSYSHPQSNVSFILQSQSNQQSCLLDALLNFIVSSEPIRTFLGKRFDALTQSKNIFCR